MTTNILHNRNIYHITFLSDSDEPGDEEIIEIVCEPPKGVCYIVDFANLPEDLQERITDRIRFL
jgi:hypothetical protein